MKRIIVIGCPGSGKSTFSRRLKDATGYPLYHLDMIYHKPDRTTVSREEFDKKLREIMEGEYWIIDGNYNRTIEMRLKECDTVFLFDLPTEVSIKGVMSRIGKKRDDMPWVEEEFDTEFRGIILGFREKQIPKIYELLSKYPEKKLVIFKSHTEADSFAVRSLHYSNAPLK